MLSNVADPLPPAANDTRPTVIPASAMTFPFPPPQVLVDDEKEKGCVHLKVLQEPEAKKLVFVFVGLQKDKNLDETIENF